MNTFDAIEQRIIARRGSEGFWNITQDPRTGAYAFDLTAWLYLASLPAVQVGATLPTVRGTATERPLTPAYAALLRRSEDLHARLAAIADELVSLRASYTAPADHATVATLIAGKPYEAETASIEDRAQRLDREACNLAAALVQLAGLATTQARTDAATMLATSQKNYRKADQAHAAVERKAAERRAAAEAAYAAELAACEAMQVATRDELNVSAWDLAWAEDLPATAYSDVRHERAAALTSTARAGYVAPVQPSRPAGWVNSISDAGGY